MLALFSLLQIAGAEDILVPHITPVQFEDLVISEQVENKLVSSLEQLGMSVIRPSTLDQEFSDEVVSSCFDSPSCAELLFTRDGSVLALIGSLETTASGYNLQMRFYGKTSRSPLDVQMMTIKPEELDDVVLQIAEDASVMFSLIPKEDAPAPQAPVVVEEQEPKVVIIEQYREKEYVQPPPNKVILSLPDKLQQEYIDSKMMPDDWIRQQRIRAMNILVELHAGLALGDVARSYDTRVGFREDAESVFDIYEYDTFFPGTGAMLGGAVGFAPLWWLEASIYGGVILAQKELSTGWEMQENGQIIDSSELEYDPVLAVSGHIEPRMRFYFLPSGPVKPYALAGGYIRIFDGYVVPDVYNTNGTKIVDYANQPWGLHYGVTAGGGFAFDSAGPVGVFVEVPWTYVLNQVPYEKSNQLIQDVPERPGNSNQVVGIKLGMALRFH